MKEKLLKLIESIDTEKVLTEDQRKELEQFGETIVTKMNDERESGYKTGFDKSKEIAESYFIEYDEKIDESLKSLFESVDQLIEKREEIAISENNNNDEIVGKLDDYLNAYLKESMPESVVIDYNKLQRLEKMSESLKDVMLITDEMVQEKVELVSNTLTEETAEIRENLEMKTQQLQEEMEKRIKIQRELSTLQASELLETKLTDIPNLESTKLRKHFNNSTVEDINESFDTIYSDIRYGIVNEKEDVDVSDKIKSIIAEVVTDEVIEESIDTDEVVESVMSSYATYVNKLDK